MRAGLIRTLSAKQAARSFPIQYMVSPRRHNAHSTLRLADDLQVEQEGSRGRWPHAAAIKVLCQARDEKFIVTISVLQRLLHVLLQMHPYLQSWTAGAR